MGKRLILRKPAFEQRRKHLARPHARQRAPGGARHAGGQRRAVNGVFDQTLVDALRGERIRQPEVIGAGNAVQAFAAADKQAAGRRIASCPVETDLHPVPRRLSRGIEGPLAGKDGQKHLLDRVLIGMSLQI